MTREGIFLTDNMDSSDNRPVDSEASLPANSSSEVSTSDDLAQLVFKSSDSKTMTKNVLRPTTLLGSATGCNVRLLSSSVAPSHAVITYDQKEFRIWDLRSTTGTFVNGQKVIHARLNDGDEIKIGRFEFKMETNLVNKGRKGFFIDDYRVLSILGTGGMGWLYAVENFKTGQRLALKVLTRKGDRRGVDDHELRLRFWFEGRAGRGADHPNIVKALGYQCRSDVDYIIMELVESITLQEWIERDKRIPYPIACSVVQQVAHALEHIHQQGPVHRDIKPANVLIEKTGDVKLCDFGLVYLGNDPKEDVIAKQMEGDCLGTADFISPEQSLDSYGVDGRADIYSLGCTFYLALSGKMPFEGKTAREKLDGHRNKMAPSIKGLVPNLPDGVIEILEKSMDKDPDKRFATAAEMAKALEPYAEKQDVEFDFQKLLTKRTVQARVRLTDKNRSHYLERIPPNIVMGTLGITPDKSAKKQDVVESDSSKVLAVMEDQGHAPGDTVPTGTSHSDIATNWPEEVKSLAREWDSLSESKKEKIRKWIEMSSEMDSPSIVSLPELMGDD